MEVFPHLQNHTAVATRRTIQPWDYVPHDVPSLPKDRYREWCKASDTDHCFFTAAVGLNSAVRVSDENPAFQLLGLVADYDAPIESGDWEKIHRVAAPDYKPAFGSLTPSGHGRLVWLFEEPLHVPHEKLLESFLKLAIRETRMEKLLPGFEKEALLDVAKTYDVGTGWRKISEQTISAAMLQHWVFKAAEKIGYAGPAKTEVPIERVAAEVEKKFPGRWKGEFRVGARGIRFWDPTADNHTAAIVCDSGMLTFTGQPFVPWREIFGAKFVEEFQADRIAAATSESHYDGKHYWQKTHDGEWVCKVKEDLVLDLKVRCGLSASSFRGEPSETDRALYFIQSTNRVAKALPYVHQSHGIIRKNGKRCLNISAARVIEPASEAGTWGERFPFIGAWLSPEFFAAPSQEQWEYFMAELRHLYASAHALSMEKGHAMFFAGPTDKGKTLLQTVLIGGLLGGSCDVADYMLKQSNFNGSYFNNAVWTIDDSTPGKDPKTRIQFTAMVKKFVANNLFEFTQKFRDSADIDWKGRLLVSLNEDPESLQMLPDAQLSLLDKVCLFKIGAREFKFPAKADRVVREEMPYFARWLLDYEPPSHCTGGARFGVREYHHPELLDTARRIGNTTEFQEILSLFRRSYFASLEAGKPKVWKGTATKLIGAMMEDDSVRDIITQARLSSTRVASELAKLAGMGFQIKVSVVHGEKLWVIREEPGDLESREHDDE